MDEKTLALAADFVAPFEGFSARVYKCPAGLYTFGYGSLLKNYQGLYFPITKETGKEYLIKDLKVALAAVDQFVTVPLNINQVVALMSFVHNVGAGNFRTSTLRMKLNQGKYAEASDQFLRWNKCNDSVLPGLTKRRIAERALFLKEPEYPPLPTNQTTQGINNERSSQPEALQL